MAQEAHNREDFLAEAKNLTERAEFQIAEYPESIIVGFRPDGCGSIYFGPERVYHFNTEGQLRRGHLDGLLYKADHERLIRMQRHRLTDRVELRSRPLTPAEQKKFLTELNQYLSTFAARLEHGNYTILGQVPPSANPAVRVLAWLRLLRKQPKVAASPHAA